MIKTSLIALGVALSSAALVACSSSSSGGGGDGGTDGGNPIDSGHPSDSGNPTDSGHPTDSGNPTDSGPTDGGMDQMAGMPFQGSVFAVTTPSAAGNTFSVDAAFIASVSPGTPCAGGSMMGTCCYMPAAVPTDAGPVDAGMPMIVTAGNIDITNEAGDAGVGTLMPGAMGYMPLTGPTPDMSVQWTAGDKLDVSAAGDSMGVHMFTGAIQTGDTITGDMPALSFTNPVTINRTMDYTQAWTADSTATGDKVVLAIATTADGSITCTADDSAGTVTVPNMLLSNFSAGMGFVTLTRTNSSMATGPNNATVSLDHTTSILGSATIQ